MARKPVTFKEYLAVGADSLESFPVTEAQAREIIASTVDAARLSEDGSPIALIGFNMLRENVASVWLRLSASARKQPIKTVRWIRRMLKRMVDEYPFIHRIEGTCMADSRKHCRLMEAAYFKYEGTLRQGLHPQQDLALYSFIPEVDSPWKS